MAWDINDRIYFDMAIERAKFLYRRSRKNKNWLHKALYNRVMDAAKLHDMLDKRPFKRTGRARP